MAQFSDVKCLNLGGSPQRRRMKQTLPDSAKDEIYWTKRLKNNLSAKKSRDNRRKHDDMLRTRVALLEKENAELRAELWALKKKKAGLVDPNAMIVVSDNEEVTSQAQSLYKSTLSRLDPAETRPLVDDYTEMTESIKSEVHKFVDLNSHPCISDRIATQMKGRPVDGTFSRKAGSDYLKDALRRIPPPRNDVSRSPYHVEDQVRTAYCEVDEYDDEPTDLSMTSYHRGESMEEDGNGKSVTDTSDSNNSVQRENVDDYISSCERFQERTDSKDIREELMALSEQLKQMQKIVCNKMS